MNGAIITISLIGLLIALSILLGFWPYLLAGTCALFTIIWLVNLMLKRRDIKSSLRSQQRIQPSTLQKTPIQSFNEGFRRIVEDEWNEKSSFGDVEDLK